jgi:hypothetical protein
LVNILVAIIHQWAETRTMLVDVRVFFFILSLAFAFVSRRHCSGNGVTTLYVQQAGQESS